MCLFSNRPQKTSKCGKNTAVTHLANTTYTTFFFLLLPNLVVICDLLLNKSTATWSLSVKSIYHGQGPQSTFESHGVEGSLGMDHRSVRGRGRGRCLGVNNTVGKKLGSAILSLLHTSNCSNPCNEPDCDPLEWRRASAERPGKFTELTAWTLLDLKPSIVYSHGRLAVTRQVLLWSAKRNQMLNF